jgi:signal transduction histidine kinase
VDTVPRTDRRPRIAFEALATLSLDLVAADSMRRVVAAAERWAIATFADATISLSRPDRMGRLRLVEVRRGSTVSGRKHSARRREALERGEASSFDVVATGRRLAIVPANVGNRTVAVLELEAAAEDVSRGWTALEAAAAQVASAIDRVTKEERLRRDLEAMRRAATLGRDLDRVRSPRAAVRIVCRFMADAFAVPVAAWYGDGDGRATLVEVAGLGSRKRKEVRRALSALRLRRGRQDRDRALRAFAEVVGTSQIRDLEVDRAIFLVADADAAVEPVFEVARPLLANAIRGLRALEEVDHGRATLHARGAWAAHELRAPILGLRAALNVVLAAVARGDAADTTILRRSVAELEHLASLSETVLTSPVDGRVPRLGSTDVVPLIREAVDAIELERQDESRVILIGATEAVAPVDRIYLRTAIDNLLRNAIAYSDPHTKVTVEVEAHFDGVEICVQNETTGPAPEVELLFTPFVRRKAAGRRGSGLGLFIASQAVRAQGGRLWAESSGNVIEFHIAITGGGKEELRSVS